MVKSIFATLIGIASTIILAQIGLINWIVSSFLYLVSSQEAWWIRLIFWIILLVVLFIVYYLKNMALQEIKKNKESKEKADIKERVKESESFVKGIKEGQKITKDLN